MLIGVPKEIKVDEYRVGLTPASVRELVSHGHDVLVEHLAGDVIGLHDSDYKRAGAKICVSADEIFAQAELIVKVKEPQVEEFDLIHGRHILFLLFTFSCCR